MIFRNYLITRSQAHGAYVHEKGHIHTYSVHMYVTCVTTNELVRADSKSHF